MKNIVIPGKEVERVISNKFIKAMTLTGSEEAGSSAAANAAKYLKKSVLELGGSDPFIIHSDANIKAASENAFISRMINNGQSCIAAKRFIIHESFYQEFIDLTLKKISRIKMGDPLKSETDLGPLVNERAADELFQLIKANKDITVHGELKKNGSFLSPVLLTNIGKESILYDKELFGPIFSVFSYSGLEEAIELANDSSHGLSSAIWTSSKKVAETVSKRLETGAVFINGFSKSDPRLPFGGIKNSGFGRELSREGILEFVNVKLINQSASEELK